MGRLIEGHKLILSVGTSQNVAPIAASRDCSLSISTELIEKSGTNATWKEYLAGLNEWSISASGLLVAAHTSVLRLQIARTKLSVSFAIGSETFTGEGYIDSSSYSGGVQGKGTWQISIKGSGALE